MLRDHLYELSASAALNPTRESRFLLPGQDRRPADIFIPSWAGGLDAAIDVTVVTATPGHALSFRYNTKMAGSAEDCRKEGIKFLPVVIETLGGWHQGAVEQVKKLASAKARHSGQEDEEALRHAFTRLSIILMKGNAAILSNRLPTFSPSNVDGIQQ